MATRQTNELGFTIANGQSLSAALKLNGGFLEGVYMPAAWTAAGLSFAVCETEAGTYVPLVDSLGAEVTLTVAAGQAIALPIGAVRGWNWIKLRSGTSAAAVNQGADRALVAVTRPYS